jgi:predicted phage tail protein
LEANFPGEFSGHIREGSYHVVVGDPENEEDYYTEELINFNSMQRPIHIIPAIAGSKSGGGKGGKGMILAIIGIALLAVATMGAAGFLGGAALGAGTLTAGFAASTGILGITWGTVALFGGALALAGISQLLSPTPKDDAKKTMARSKASSLTGL